MDFTLQASGSYARPLNTKYARLNSQKHEISVLAPCVGRQQAVLCDAPLLKSS